MPGGEPQRSHRRRRLVEEGSHGTGSNTGRAVGSTAGIHRMLAHNWSNAATRPVATRTDHTYYIIPVDRYRVPTSNLCTSTASIESTQHQILQSEKSKRRRRPLEGPGQGEEVVNRSYKTHSTASSQMVDPPPQLFGIFNQLRKIGLFFR